MGTRATPTASPSAASTFSFGIQNADVETGVFFFFRNVTVVMLAEKEEGKIPFQPTEMPLHL